MLNPGCCPPLFSSPNIEGWNQEEEGVQFEHEAYLRLPALFLLRHNLSKRFDPDFLRRRWVVIFNNNSVKRSYACHSFDLLRSTLFGARPRTSSFRKLVFLVWWNALAMRRFWYLDRHLSQSGLSVHEVICPKLFQNTEEGTPLELSCLCGRWFDSLLSASFQRILLKKHLRTQLKTESDEYVTEMLKTGITSSISRLLPTRTVTVHDCMIAASKRTFTSVLRSRKTHDADVRTEVEVGAGES